MCSSSSTFHTVPNPFTQTQTRISLPTRPKPVQIRASSRSGSVTWSRPDPNLYSVLGITENVSLGEIKKAYKEMALKYHPDVSPPGRVEEYTDRFIKVQQAYETLSDPNSRALYDCDLSNGLHLAFSARRRFNDHDLRFGILKQEMEYKSEWKNRWQGQLAELKLRSANKNSHDNTSWGAKIRRQMNDSSDEV